MFVTYTIRCLPPLAGEKLSSVVHNGHSVGPLRCLAAGGRPHQWEAVGVKGSRAGQRIDISSYLDAGSLTFIADDAVNTGIYRCVDAGDDQMVYDQYVVLTRSECIATYGHV